MQASSQLTHFAWQLEDSSDVLDLEDGSGNWLLESQDVHTGLEIVGTHATQAVYVGLGRGGREDPVEFTFLTKAGISFTTAVKFRIASPIRKEVKSNIKLKSRIIFETRYTTKLKSTLIRPTEYKSNINTLPRPEFTTVITGTTDTENLKKSLFKKLKELEDDDK